MDLPYPVICHVSYINIKVLMCDPQEKYLQEKLMSLKVFELKELIQKYQIFPIENSYKI